MLDSVLNARGDELEFICDACGKKMEVTLYDYERSIVVRLKCQECDKLVSKLESEIDELKEEREDLFEEIDQRERDIDDIKDAARRAIESLEDLI